MFKAILATMFLATIISFTVCFIDKVSADDGGMYYSGGEAMQFTTGSMSIPYVKNGTADMHYDRNTGSCEWFAFDATGSYHYYYILDAIVTYELTWFDGGTKVVSCSAR